MITIPDDILAQYEAALKKRAIAATRHSEYRKWLRYYLDFCSKYRPPDSKSERVRLFIEKLRGKSRLLNSNSRPLMPYLSTSRSRKKAGLSFSENDRGSCLSSEADGPTAEVLVRNRIC